MGPESYASQVSISIVNAASIGLPLVIADAPVEKFAIENENGFAFKIGDVATLQKILKKLVEDKELRKEMGQKSRQLVEQKLNWKNIASQYLEVYKQTVGSKIE